MQHQINTKDITAHINELPTIMVGIGNRTTSLHENTDDDYVVLLKLNEETDGINHRNIHAVISDAALHILDGKDYHTELDAYHKAIKHEDAVAHDSVIYDILKKGKPDGDTVSKIVHSWSDAPLTHVSTYLNKKWTPFLETHAKEPVSIEHNSGAGYTYNELNSIPKTFDLAGLRMLRHRDSGHLFEYHPTQGMRYLGGRHSVPYDARSQSDTAHRNLEEMLEDINAHHVGTPRISTPLKAYTADSVPVNSYLHKKYHGTLDSDVIRGADVNELETMSNNISAHIRHTAQPNPHLPDFTVYTGVYSENKLGEGDTKIDEHGNLIYHNPAFTSTSISRQTADTFAKSKYTDKLDNMRVRDVLRIKIPGGYPNGIYVGTQSEHDNEKEYLLDKGHTFKISPKPTQIVSIDTQSAPIRVWDAEIHHDPVDESIPFSAHTINNKLNLTVRPDAKVPHLLEAAKDADEVVRASAARHPNTPSATVNKLAKDSFYIVRQAAGLNPSLDDDVVNAHKDDPHFAKGLAMRENLPEHHFSSLIKHPYASVTQHMAMRHDLHGQHLVDIIDQGVQQAKIAGNNRPAPILETLAKNTHVNPEALDALFHHPNPNVKEALAENSSVPDTTIHKMMADHDTRFKVRYNPAYYRLSIIRRM